MNNQIIKIANLISNNGKQVPGLPKNPRVIKDSKYKALLTSIKEDPEMLELRELIVYPVNNKFVVIAGNMRLKACIELGFKELNCKVLDIETPIEKLKAFTIKDNVSFGSHDWESLNLEWNKIELSNWGLDVPSEAQTIEGTAPMTKTNPKKKSIMIQFEPNDYDEAFALVQFFKNRDYYIGGSLIHLLAQEKKVITLEN